LYHSIGASGWAFWQTDFKKKRTKQWLAFSTARLKLEAPQTHVTSRPPKIAINNCEATQNLLLQIIS